MHRRHTIDIGVHLGGTTSPSPTQISGEALFILDGKNNEIT